MTTQTTKLSGTFSALQTSNGGLVQRLLRAIRVTAAAAPCSAHLQHDRGETDCRPAPEGPYRPLAFTASVEAMKLRAF
jgi:hypothetical protein